MCRSKIPQSGGCSVISRLGGDRWLRFWAVDKATMTIVGWSVNGALTAQLVQPLPSANLLKAISPTIANPDVKSEMERRYSSFAGKAVLPVQ